MPVDFKNRGELFNHLRETAAAYSTPRNALVAEFAVSIAYDSAIQWYASRGTPTGNNSGLRRIATNMNPDQQLRVVCNQVSTLVQNVAARSFPADYKMEILPPPRNRSIWDTNTARILRDAAGVLVDSSGYLGRRRFANNMRTVTGTYGVGWTIEFGNRNMEVKGKKRDFVDSKIRAFDFDPTKLILDPGVNCPDLNDHDFVWYQDVWTESHLRRAYPKLMEGVEPDQMATVGQLASRYVEMSNLSSSSLFYQYKLYSKTKGALVYQGHYKSDTGRFDRYYTIVEFQQGASNSNQSETMVWVNEDDPVSPFGGNGLPLSLIHGHPSSQSMFSRGDVWMMRSDQNLLNLSETLKQRILQRWSAYKIAIDKRSLTDQDNAESVQRQWDNTQAGIITYDSRGNKGVNPPAVLQMPSPPGFLDQSADRYKQNMQEKVNRPDTTQGITKSHVPNESFQAAIEQADQVPEMRIARDIENDQRMLSVGLGTMIRSARTKSPSTLGDLTEAGFDEQDLQILMSSNPIQPPGKIKVRAGSVRHRSPAGRRADIQAGVNNQIISPIDARLAFANDVDTPFTEKDRVFANEAEKFAMNVANGEDWIPMPVGPVYSEFLLQSFRQTLLDERVANDPETRQRVTEAIRSQQEMATQEEIASNPELRLQAEQMAQQAEQAQQGEQQPAQQAPESATVADVLAGLSA